MLIVYNIYGGVSVGVLENADGISVTSEINGEYGLEFTLPAADAKLSLLEENVTCIKYTGNGQFYRVKKTSKLRSGSPAYTVMCEHVFMDSKNVFYAGFEHQNGVAANDLFGSIWTNARGFSLFNDEEIEDMGMSVVTTETDFDDKNKTNPWELTNNLIDLIGQGEVYIDNKAVALVAEIGAQYPTLRLDLKYNVDSITVEKDTSELITRLYAFGKNDLDLTSVAANEYIDSPNISKYGIIEGYKDFSDISDSELLGARAEWQFDSRNPSRIDEPYISISCKFIDMSSINPNIDKPHLGQRVDVEGYSGLRIIKMIEKPLEPYNTEIVIGRIKKDLFYFFKRFNSTSYTVSSGKASTQNNTVVKETTTEIVKQEAVAADVINATAAFIDDLQIERLQTNFKNYICLPNISVVNGSPVWDGETHTWRAREGHTGETIRDYISIEEISQQFIEAHLVVPSNAAAMTAAEVTAATVNGRQLYFTAVTGSQAFEYLTFTAPTAKYASMSADEAAMYVVYTRKVAGSYVKMKHEFIWESDGAGGGTYNIRTVYGTGDANGRGQYMFVKDSTGGRLVYTSRTNGLEYGNAIDDDGAKVVVGGVKCPELYGKVYESLEAAQADRGNLPYGAIVMVITGS